MYNHAYSPALHCVWSGDARRYGFYLMKLVYKKIHSIGLILSIIFFVLATHVIVQGEREAIRREKIIEGKKQKNHQEILNLRAKLKDKGITKTDRDCILSEIKYRKKYGWMWTSAILPSNARNPGRVAGFALSLAGIACLFYRPGKKNPYLDRRDRVRDRVRPN